MKSIDNPINLGQDRSATMYFEDNFDCYTPHGANLTKYTPQPPNPMDKFIANIKMYNV